MKPVFRFLGAAAACLATITLAQANTVIVTQSNFGFTPTNITINVGDTVQWNWQNFSHTVTEGNDGLINGNELFTFPLDQAHPTVSFTFDAAFVAAHPMPGGLYNYFCAIHWPIMTGTITVNGPAATGTPNCFGDGSGTACPCGNNSAVGAQAGCLNSLATAGQLTASGTASISADSVVLTGTGMPTSSALYFQGTTAIGAGAGAAFGDGLRCAGGSVIRLALKTNNASGSSSFPTGADPSASVKGGASAGSTFEYQVWYRNAGAFCTSSTFNLSNGYSITWTP